MPEPEECILSFLCGTLPLVSLIFYLLRTVNMIIFWHMTLATTRRSQAVYIAHAKRDRINSNNYSFKVAMSSFRFAPVYQRGTGRQHKNG